MLNKIPNKLITARLLILLILQYSFHFVPYKAIADDLVLATGSSLEFTDPCFQNNMRNYIHSLNDAQLKVLVDWVKDSKDFQLFFDDKIFRLLIESGNIDGLIEEMLNRPDSDSWFKRYEKIETMLNMPKLEFTPTSDICLYRNGHPLSECGLTRRPLATSSSIIPGDGIYVRPDNVNITFNLNKGGKYDIFPIPNTFQSIGINEELAGRRGLNYHPPSRNLGGFATMSNEIVIPYGSSYRASSLINNSQSVIIESKAVVDPCSRNTGPRIGGSSAYGYFPAADVVFERINRDTDGGVDRLASEIVKRVYIDPGIRREFTRACEAEEKITNKSIEKLGINTPWRIISGYCSWVAKTANDILDGRMDSCSGI